MVRLAFFEEGYEKGWMIDMEIQHKLIISKAELIDLLLKEYVKEYIKKGGVNK